MCLSISGKIISINSPFARVEIHGIETKINIELLENPREGDLVLIHSGFALQKIDEKYFNYLDETLESMMKEEEDE